MKSARLLTPLITCGVLLLSGCAAKGIVMGSVIEGKNNRPIGTGKVILTPVDGKEVQSGSLQYGGQFKLKVEEGEYVISVEHEDMILCDSTPATISVQANKIAETQLCLQKPE